MQHHSHQQLLPVKVVRISNLNSLENTLHFLLNLGLCEILDGEEGTFASPNYPSSYPNNARSCWIITNVPQRLTLQVVRFETEYRHDVLTVTYYLGNVECR